MATPAVAIPHSKKATEYKRLVLTYSLLKDKTTPRALAMYKRIKDGMMELQDKDLMTIVR